MDVARVSNDEQNVGTHITPYSSDMNVDTIERKMLSKVDYSFSCVVLLLVSCWIHDELCNRMLLLFFQNIRGYLDNNDSICNLVFCSD